MTRPVSPREAYRHVTEADFQNQIFVLLRKNGWKVAHFRTARVGKSWMTPVQADGKGWPDLFCIHPSSADMIAVELKREYNAPVTVEQAEWLGWLERAGVEVAVWRPSMIDTVKVRLGKPSKSELLEERGNYPRIV